MTMAVQVVWWCWKVIMRMVVVMSDGDNSWRDYNNGSNNAGKFATKGSTWWRDMLKICGEEEGWFETQLGKRMEEGDNTNFWEHKWIRAGQTLKSKYQRLFTVSTQQHSLVKEVGEWDATHWIWQLNWRRNLFDWEKLQLENLMQDINFVPLEKGRKDS